MRVSACVRVCVCDKSIGKQVVGNIMHCVNMNGTGGWELQSALRLVCVWCVCVCVVCVCGVCVCECVCWAWGRCFTKRQHLFGLIYLVGNS